MAMWTRQFILDGKIVSGYEIIAVAFTYGLENMKEVRSDAQALRMASKILKRNGYKLSYHLEV